MQDFQELKVWAKSHEIALEILRVTIALGSASETVYHLLLARDTGATSPDRYDQLSARVVEVRRMLTGLSNCVGASPVEPPTPFVPTKCARAERGVSAQPATSTDG